VPIAEVAGLIAEPNVAAAALAPFERAGLSVIRA